MPCDFQPLVVRVVQRLLSQIRLVLAQALSSLRLEAEKTDAGFDLPIWPSQERTILDMLADLRSPRPDATVIVLILASIVTVIGVPQAAAVLAPAPQVPLYSINQASCSPRASWSASTGSRISTAASPRRPASLIRSETSSPALRRAITYFHRCARWGMSTQ